ncbi:magnesium/cobalt transporter CorA [Pseudomarimonas salicorniae]|uniref:Magnesium transport protein CorA n=1 Tax=Pseudomarimonas salicorniae TaxID=2933270 RepID=A0ABT0GCK5_9GAMM|nr:magnesium/cobalt transporter CorA [Lysobacter sp. CAU 1642]MCK7592265.1 magnesium/cobalt transporter CorA [Lysobacter sp. CAU 1642]
MIRTVLFRRHDQSLVFGGEELIAQWQAEPDSLLWADFFEHDPEQERQLLLQRFGLHKLAIQDAQRDRHQPKIETFPDYVFILLKGLGPDTGSFEFGTIQIALFIGQRFLVTRHSGPSSSIERLLAEVKEDPATCAAGPDAMALRLSRISVDRYVQRLMTLEPRLEVLEQEITENPNDELLSELTGYKTDLRKFRRVLLYHVQVFDELRQHPPAQVRADHVHEIRDVFENQERASSLATLYYEVATDLSEGYISLASHRLNNIMKVLTIVTVVFVPLSFLAGVYGMNFENMPELNSRFGYFVLLGLMAAIAVTLLYVFRRRKWL